MDRKVALITGITGQDGSYLAEKLLAEGVSVYGLTRRSARDNLGALDHPSCLAKEKVKLCWGEITDFESARKVIDSIQKIEGKPIDEVYHLAAQSHVGISHKVPKNTLEVNLIGTVNILNAAWELSKETRVYFAATSECFSGDPATCPQNELTPFHPKSPYAVSKVGAVYYARHMREKGQFIGIGFLFNHESPRRPAEFVTRKITLNMAKIKLGLQDRFGLGNMKASRDWGFAGDYVEGMTMILRHSQPDEFVLASGKTTTIEEFVQLAQSTLCLPGGPYDYCYEDPEFYRPLEVNKLQGDYSKAERILGWRPKTSLKELVREMVLWDMAILSHGLLGKQLRTQALNYLPSPSSMTTSTVQPVQ